MTAPALHTTGPVRRQGHMRRTGYDRHRMTDNTRDYLRWKLLADCERAPLGWEERGLNE